MLSSTVSRRITITCFSITSVLACILPAFAKGLPDLEAKVTQLETSISQQAAVIAQLQANVSQQAALIASLQSSCKPLTDAQILSIVSGAGYVPGPHTPASKIEPYVTVDDDNNIYITGANLHIRSGSGSTNGEINGLGNLIIGYNESQSNTRTGSHNVVVGPYHSYSSYGAFIAGRKNEVSGNYSSILGGFNGVVSGDYSTISGGANGIVSGAASSISGGSDGTVSGLYSIISGGAYGTASGDISSISGGVNGTASGNISSISGGFYGTASGPGSSVSGGAYGVAKGDNSSVLGGSHVTAEGDLSSVLGGYLGIAAGGMSTVLGGRETHATETLSIAP